MYVGGDPPPCAMFDTCTFHAPAHVLALVTVLLVCLVFLVFFFCRSCCWTGNQVGNAAQWLPWIVRLSQLVPCVGFVLMQCFSSPLVPDAPVVNKTMTERRTLLQEKFVTIPRRVRSMTTVACPPPPWASNAWSNAVLAPCSLSAVSQFELSTQKALKTPVELRTLMREVINRGGCMTHGLCVSGAWRMGWGPF
jgi:hypothetical protein